MEEAVEIFIAVVLTAFSVVMMFVLVATFAATAYFAWMWFKHRAPRSAPARTRVQPTGQGATLAMEGRNIAFTPVIVLNDGPDREFYAVVLFVPPGYKNTNAMNRGFLDAVNGLTGYMIVTEQVAIEQLGRRYGGCAYVCELDVPKVV
jgi:uncharacterized protein (UPF0333 family)